MYHGRFQFPSFRTLTRPHWYKSASWETLKQNFSHEQKGTSRWCSKPHTVQSISVKHNSRSLQSLKWTRSWLRKPRDSVLRWPFFVSNHSSICWWYRIYRRELRKPEQMRYGDSKNLVRASWTVNHSKTKAKFFVSEQLKPRNYKQLGSYINTAEDITNRQRLIWASMAERRQVQKQTNLGDTPTLETHQP